MMLGPARYERTCDSDASERTGCSKSDQLPSCQNVSGHQAQNYHHPHAADSKESSTGAEVVPGRGEGTQ